MSESLKNDVLKAVAENSSCNERNRPIKAVSHKEAYELTKAAIERGWFD